MTENEEIKKVINGLNFLKEKLYNGIYADRLDCIDYAISALKEVQQYREIGTVEECREAVEKQKAKKPLLVSKKEKIMEGDYVRVICPTCGEEIFSCFLFYPWNDSQRTHEFCESCGQAIQWDENLEETEDGA